MRQLLISLLIIPLMATSCTNKSNNPEETNESPAVENNTGYKMITARIFVKPEYTADFIESAKALIDSSNMEPGCISYQLFQDPYDQTQFIMVEEWTDQAAIDNHFTMPYFIEFNSRSEPWLLKPSEVKIVDAYTTE